MLRILFLILPVIVICLPQHIQAQCDTSEFTIEDHDKLCRNSPIRLTNDSPPGGEYYWDFCPEDFSETAQVQSLTLSGFTQGYGYQLLHDNGQWYGFAVSRSLDKIIRLDFGSSPANTPEVVDLGNPGNLMDAPEGIEFFKDGGNWYAFIGKGENSSGQIVKLKFGSDLRNVPTATGYGTFGLGSVRIRDLSIVKQGTDIVLLLLIYNSTSISRINFGGSLENAPGTSNVVSIPGAALPRGLDVVRTCDGIQLHIVCENGLVVQAGFDDDVTGPLTVQGTFSFPSIVQPWKLKTIFHGGRYLSFISCHNRKYSIIDFGDLSLTTPPKEVVNVNDARFVGIDVVKWNGKTLIQGANLGGNLINVTYQRDCALTQDYSYDEHPAPFTYSEAGAYRIDLTSIQHSTSVSYDLAVIDRDAPDVSIGYEGICQGNEVSYYPSDGTVVAWSWDLGNAVQSVVERPQTIYDLPGIYSVSMKAVGSNGCTVSDQLEMKIYPPPDAGFNIPSALLCTNNDFTFSSTTIDAYDGHLTYQWTVDNLDAGNQRDLTYAFESTGVKQIRLRTSIPGCSDELTRDTPPIEKGPRIDYDFSGMCEDEPYEFRYEISDPITSFSWDFGNGETSTDSNPEKVFHESGSYSVTLAAINTIGCETRVTKNIEVRSTPLVDFLQGELPNGCSGEITHFRNVTLNPDGQPITEWLWTYGDLTNPQHSTQTDGRHLFEDAGTYHISLNATTIDGCVGAIEKEISILQSPSVSFDHTPACKGTPVNFAYSNAMDIRSIYWEIGTHYYTEVSPTHTFSLPGEYPLYLEVQGDNGCLSTFTDMLHVPAPLTPNFSVEKNCVGENAMLTDLTTGVDPVTVTQWRFDDGAILTGSPLEYTFDKEGSEVVRLIVSTQSGCSYYLERTVEVTPSPVAGFAASPAYGAHPLEVTFANTSSGTTRWSWHFGEEPGSASDQHSPVHTFSGEGTHPVTLVASNEQGCQDSFTDIVRTMPPLPDVDVEMINLTTNSDGSAKLIVTIHNKGNTILKGLPVNIDFDGLKFRQTLSDPVLPSARFNFVFNTSIVNPGSLRYLCVSLDLNGDLSPAGNQLCKQFDTSPPVLPAYPNPTDGNLTVEWMAAVATPVRLILVDALGREAINVTVPGVQGMNVHMLDLSGLENGLYSLILDQSKSKTTQRIVLLNTR